MSAREWKPGDVGWNESGGRVFVYRDSDSGQLRYRFDDDSGARPLSDIAGHIRPLVVVDPEDREQVALLADAFCNARWSHLPDSDECDPLTRSSMQAALRSLLEPQKPEEPAGIGAVVEYDGSVWISLGHHRWLELPDDRLIEPRRFHWADFPSGVRNRSDGWTPDASGGAS